MTFFKVNLPEIESNKEASLGKFWALPLVAAFSGFEVAAVLELLQHLLFHTSARFR